MNLVEEPLDPATCIEGVSSPSCGAVSLFLGTVRDTSNGKKVKELYYEAYPAMVAKVWDQIVEEIRQQFPDVEGIDCVHRVGTVSVGETAIIIAAASPHRAPALAAIHHVIDRLKEVAPIWKKETFADGSHWVGLGAG